MSFDRSQVCICVMNWLRVALEDCSGLYTGFGKPKSTNRSQGRGEHHQPNLGSQDGVYLQILPPEDRPYWDLRMCVLPCLLCRTWSDLERRLKWACISSRPVYSYQQFCVTRCKLANNLQPPLETNSSLSPFWSAAQPAFRWRWTPSRTERSCQRPSKALHSGNDGCVA